MNDTEAYRHFIPKIDLSVERNTSNVPNDGRYHIVKAGKVIQSFRYMQKAEERFRQLLNESGFQPQPSHSKKFSPSDEAVDRYVLAKEIFWAEGPKYINKRGKGGRGGRGGV